MTELELTPELLLSAYSIGLFPMAESADDPFLHWIDPDLRGAMEIGDFHVPRRLRKLIRQAPFSIRVNTAFRQTMEFCAEEADNRPDTWINDTILDLYTELHEQGQAHSVECWLEERMVGGLYGVSLGAAFFGESMFSRVNNASKVALVALVAIMKKSGFTLLDCQFWTEHLSQFGITEIERDVYQELLQSALMERPQFVEEITASELAEFLQSTTQTS